MLVYLLSMLEQPNELARFRQLYQDYHGLMLAVALKILPRQREAEDAVQNAFVKIIRNFEKISELSCEKLPAYLVSIVKNESITLLRKRHKGEVPLEDWAEYEQPAIVSPRYRALVEAFRQLPDTYRTAAEMKLLLGYSEREIAKQLGLTESAVSTRISRAKKMLQQIIIEEGLLDD